MPAPDTTTLEALPEDEPVPAIQQILENPFLLLFIGVAMPTVLYIVWGVMEIVNIPVAK
jgi:tetrahydromethanopterin S-methyltransferase subunit B